MKRKRKKNYRFNEKDVRAIRGGSDVATENRIMIPEQHHCTAPQSKTQMEATVHERFN